MKFNDFEYKRPDMGELRTKFKTHITEIKEAQSADEAIAAVKAIQDLQRDIETNSTLTSIRHSVDTRDKFYSDETDFWDENSPLISEWESEYYRAVLDSNYRKELEEVLPHTFFKLAENHLKIFSSEIIPLLQKENRLVSEYGKLKASAEIEYKGEIYNLSSIGAFTQDKDRKVRKETSELITDWYLERQDEFDRIYDQLVKTRHEIATTLGFKDFVEVGYARMARLDYDRKDVEVYRQEVQKHVVPLAEKLFERQRERLGLDKLAFYDLGLTFPTGNAKPEGSPEEIVAKGVEMYHELSPETGEFIDLLIDHDVLDLESKPGKDTGGYCTYLPNYKTPYIFANFNGTSHDVEVLTHEAGHAFQVYNSRWIQTPEAVWPTLESCEIHSMSMEFLTWPWMKNFFGDSIEKFKYQHLAGAVQFIPYGVCVDHFQHEVYENPNMTPEERRQAWRKLEKIYTPWIDYQGNEFYENGGWWFKQLHIFTMPFYYIDYTLAQVCAFQFWKRSQVDHDPKAWEDYLNICKVGGTQTFTEIIATGNLKSPFEKGNLADTLASIEAYLDQVDEATLRK
ncbi:M3 family oligoendopeptidase [Facklamia miroungae]|uniref:Oligoendopeptidase, M3 family n=1 Tax=Facklamia miroungae TaxID=120956 RepID=A0A1G7THT4_9LACT|nr:M3 family oligoendopeptidase [Facklamia miroungae]NKZ29835.1 M3 family oligoendopeptidase [Facklamia miroungae]SDG34672.1 oligoendopeptidase, M3 family [Facklamia miroungae]